MDLRWLADLDPFGAETASAEEELEQDLVHVLEQDVGSNGDDPTRGMGIANLLSSVLPNNFTAKVDAELMQDDRVNTASASIQRVGDGATEVDTLSVIVEPNDPLLQQLNLTVPIGSSLVPKA